ncbi:MAG: helix-turn-helix domain-containing protein [Clostridium neonatale]
MSLIGTKIKTCRKAKKLSLKQLCEKTNNQISISFLSDIENGRSNPSLEKLKLIASVLDIPVSYFLDDTENSLNNIATSDKDFIPVLELLNDFSSWSFEDKQELLYYLKAKKVLRDNR